MYRQSSISTYQSVWSITLTKWIRNYIIISYLKKKHLKKSRSFYEKIVHQKVHRGYKLQQKKVIYDMTNLQLTSYSMENNQPTKTSDSFSSKIRYKKRMFALDTFIQHDVGSPHHSNQTWRRNKSHPTWKGRSKTVTLCRWHDTIYRKP